MAGRVHYVRTSPGTGWADAVFEHTSTPSAFYKSAIRWNGHGWDLTLKDGTVYVFGENAPLQAIRDRYGNTMTVAHANGQTGNITPRDIAERPVDRLQLRRKQPNRAGPGQRRSNREVHLRRTWSPVEGHGSQTAA